MDRHLNTKALLLQRRTWNDKDLWIQLLTDYGEKIECIAKGASMPNSKRKAHLEPLTFSSFTLYKNEKHYYLQSAQIIDSFNALKDNLEKSLEAQSLLIIIEKLIPHSEINNQAVFESAMSALKNMNNSDQNSGLILEHCLVQIADNFGFLPSFKDCHFCHKFINDDSAKWNAENMTLSCGGCSQLSCDALHLKYRKLIEHFKTNSNQSVLNIRITGSEKLFFRNFLMQFFANYLPESYLNMLTGIFPVHA